VTLEPAMTEMALLSYTAIVIGPQCYSYGRSNEDVTDGNELSPAHPGRCLGPHNAFSRRRRSVRYDKE
jgi:hypothetical protein